MAKKILFNIFLNLGILTIGMCLFWLFNNKQYPLMVGAVFVLALLIYFKIRLIKAVKTQVKNDTLKK